MGLSCVHRNGAPVLHFGAQEPSVEDVGLLTIMGGCYMHFTEINAGNLARWEGAVHYRLLIGRNRLILRPRPVDNDRFRERPGSEESKRSVAFPVGESQLPAQESHRTPFVLHAEVTLALVRGVGVGIFFAPLPPTLQTCKEGLHAGIGSVGMQLAGCVPAHEVRGPQPEALVPDGAPERDERLGIESPAFLREFVQLRGFANAYVAYEIVLHINGFFFSTPKAAMCPCARAQADMRLTARSKKTAACGEQKPLSGHMREHLPLD
jgi:hypothetical protein